MAAHCWTEGRIKAKKPKLKYTQSGRKSQSCNVARKTLHFEYLRCVFYFLPTRFSLLVLDNSR